MQEADRTTGRLAGTPLLPALWTSAPLWINPAVADWLLGSGELGHPLLSSAAWALGLGLCAWGVWCLRRAPSRAPSRAMQRVHALLVGAVILLPLLGELALRTAIARDVCDMRRQGLYADAYSDDDYWKLKRRWDPPANPPSGSRIDPELGWANPRTPRNPLGAVSEPGYEVVREGAVVFFGDSFIAGTVPYRYKIPQITQQLLRDRPVYNLGQGGYGLDQIYLRFRRDHGQFVDPWVVVGIYVGDLDRSLLAVRTAPKPRFRLEAGELVLEGTPLPADPAEWFAEHPPEIVSYLLAWWVRSLQRSLMPGAEAGAYRRAEKAALNRRILEAIVEEARAHDLPLLVVPIPQKHNLDPPCWRYTFLAENLNELGVPWIDVHAELLEQAREAGTPARDLYGKDNHLNARGNMVVARAVAAELRSWRPGGPGDESGR